MADRKRLEPSKAKFRSSISNGSALLTGIDGRSLIARRYRDVASAIASDLGGADLLSEAQAQMIRTASGLAVLREHLDVKAINGQRVDAVEYARIANSLTRVLSTIGLKRVPRDVVPSLESYARTFKNPLSDEGLTDRRGSAP